MRKPSQPLLLAEQFTKLHRHSWTHVHVRSCMCLHMVLKTKESPPEKKTAMSRLLLVRKAAKPVLRPPSRPAAVLPVPLSAELCEMLA